MSAGAPFPERVAALMESGAVAVRRPPALAGWPFDEAEPADLAALYAVTDGLELSDGTTILPRGELEPTTRWLIEEKGLSWGPGLVVLGERSGVVLVRDLRPGPRVREAAIEGGVLDAATDALETFRTVAGDLVSYLEGRAALRL